MAERIVKALCSMCGMGCGMDVMVEEGRVTRVRGMEEHVLSHLCPRGQASASYQNDDNRLLYPMLKENGRFRRINWDTALDILADRLRAVDREHGPEALAIYFGDPVGLRETRHFPRWFAQAYGTPNVCSNGSFCHYANDVGMRLTFGTFVTPSLRGAKSLFLWGSNPRISAPPVLSLALNAAEKQGTQIVTIDPRVTQTTKRSTRHVRIRPGTDAALALGMLRVMITERLYDRDFVEKWTIGFSELAAAAEQWDPQRVERVTGVPAETVVEIARLYGSSTPSTMIMATSPEHNLNGVQTVRAIACMLAIAGNFDVPGGHVYVEPIRMQQPLFEREPSLDRQVGRREYPLFCDAIGEAHAGRLIELLRSGQTSPIKALIVQGSNPAVTWPSTAATVEALGSVEFLAVMDTHLTASAEQGQLILPAATFLERTEMVDYGYFEGMPLVSLSNQAVEPRGEAWPDWKLWFELARRMGLERYFPWKEVDQAFAFMLTPLGITLDQLRANPRGVFYGGKDSRRYEKVGFDTPSGKVELYSQRLAELGHAPVPAWSDPWVEEARAYPLTLSTGGRVLAYTHSKFRDLPELRRLAPEPVIEIGPNTASTHGIADGAPAIVETPTGHVRMTARVLQEMMEGVVHVTHGWPGAANANLLIDHVRVDSISGFPAYKGTPCRVRADA